MGKDLRVLIVDDSEEDTLLLVRALEQGSFIPTYKQVYTADAMTAALEEPWDLVVSDYKMPQFNGAEALAVCQKKAWDTPFILVSGRIGEEVAVEIMKAGAHDYVMKDDLARLVPAVTRELRAAEERRIRRQAELTMAHLASIVETCDDAIISYALDGTLLSWNSGAERIFGYRANEMIGRSIVRLVPRERRGELTEIRELIERGERLEHIETIRVRKDGKAIDVSTTISPIKDAKGWISGASVVIRDITQRKEREKERLRLIQELTDALAHVKTLGGLLPICSACKKIRNDDGYWEQVEIYIRNRSNAEFTHGICPDCVARLYPDLKAKMTGGSTAS